MKNLFLKNIGRTAKLIVFTAMLLAGGLIMVQAQTADKSFSTKTDKNKLESGFNGLQKEQTITATTGEIPANANAPLFICNGKEISRKEFEALNPKNIKSMTVWKGDKALEKFGLRGRDGVIEVQLI